MCVSRLSLIRGRNNEEEADALLHFAAVENKRQPHFSILAASCAPGPRCGALNSSLYPENYAVKQYFQLKTVVSKF